MNKFELKEMLKSEPLWLLTLFCQGELTQEEINLLWNGRVNHTKNLAAIQRRRPRTLKQIVKEDPKILLLSMVRVEQHQRVGINNPRREYWNRKSVRPDKVVEDPHKFNPQSDLMEEIAAYAKEARREQTDS